MNRRKILSLHRAPGALPSPVERARDARPGVLYLFALVPEGGRELRFGYRDGAVVDVSRPLSDMVDAPGEVLCSRELEAWARKRGVPCGDLPREVREARALLAHHLACAPQLRSEVAPEVMRRLLDAGALLQRVPVGADGLRLRSRLPGGGACEILLVAFPCGCIMLSLHIGPSRRPGSLPDEDVLILNIGDSPAFAVEAAQDAGWPALPVPSAIRRGRPRRVDEQELEVLIEVVRTLAQQARLLPPAEEVPMH